MTDDKLLLAMIEEKLTLLPAQPGVYLMKSAGGDIIYVGKAGILRNRVRSYFRASGRTAPKVAALAAHIADFEYIVTANELEALVLECNLIKKYRPKYNILLKDDKSYPYLKVTSAEDYPRIFATRRRLKDGSRYFGPYVNVGAMRQTVKLLREIFPLRTCRQMNARRPCLEYHIKKCLAPCSGQVDKKEYRKMADSICLLLEGRSEELLKALRKAMRQAAERLEYEEAARLRDRLLTLESLNESQTAVTVAGDADVLGLAGDGNGVCAQVFFVRSGKIVGRDNFLLTGGQDEDAAVLSAFIQQYYGAAAFIPGEVILPAALGDSEQKLLAEWLGGLCGHKVGLTAPRRGLKKDLLNMAMENAGAFLREEGRRLKNKEDEQLAAAELLARQLGLKALPARIDCFDISHIQGSETVASMVVFKDGRESRRDYRRYKIQSAEGKADDFKSMAEVVFRRYRKYDNLPDLAVIDGGKGQLGAALDVIRGLGLEFPVIALAERFEEIFREEDKEPLRLPPDSPGLRLMRRIRDEAHRFAVTYHRKLRAKRNMVSILDHIPGIGSKRRQALWRHFGTLTAIKEAPVEALAAAPGMNAASARAVYSFFRAV